VPAEASVVSGIAGRYASALFELARDQGTLDDVANDIETIAAMIDESSDLERLIRSPVIGSDDQSKGMMALLERAGIGTLASNFVGLVIRNRRLFALRDMAHGFRQLLAQHRGEVVATVTSAQTLSDTQVATLKAELAAAMKTDVNLDTRVDESILGGLVVRVGSRMVDSSLKTKLQNLRFAMRGVD
jgi:F-type H+-transporting ATPase subunit delta